MDQMAARQMLWRTLLTVNARTYSVDVEPRRTLLDVLREDLGLTGTKPNCLVGVCGSCTVLLDGQPVKSCLILAVSADGKAVTTIEGLGGYENLHPVQEAFVRHHALQCGYCTPGFLMSVVALLTRNPRPSDEEMDRALAGNLCRCTGYVNIRRAVRALVRTDK